MITMNESIVAFMDLPGEEPRLSGNDQLDHFHKSFWCGSAGVRADLLGQDESVRVFNHLLYRAFTHAQALG